MTVGARECDEKWGGGGNLRQGRKVKEKDKTVVKYECINIIYE
jgi:hypothetical protein